MKYDFTSIMDRRGRDALAVDSVGKMNGFAPSAPERERVYDALYREYLSLHDLFGRGGLDTMKRLKAIRTDALR